MNIKLDLLKKSLAEQVINNIDEIDINVDEIVNTTAISVLSEIKKYICNSELSDFEVVENIVGVFEKYNIDAGTRHDF